MTHEHDHDTVVVDERDSGSGMGAILGVLGIIVLLVAIWYFALGPGAGTTGTTTNIDNTINPPASVEAPGASAAP
jgi:hypothetical protein